ncbi:hypothetical protein [Photobacterium atrarenae]|uniref:Hydroxylamine reductase n=1 Tax=Photobacterium atrarenae TaxID=865757 RepID=A0ABY5GLY6_9GAMM|nr:hypothetical protein [Photobacterium atrarenae]UTV29943.1 hypothetical protein NNL38_23385 [Photobacterium atrarenae]
MKKYIASAVSLMVGLVVLAVAGVLAVAMMITGLIALPFVRMKLKRAAAAAAQANMATWKPGANGTVIEGEFDNITGKATS